MPCKGPFEGPWGNQDGGGIYSVPDWSATNVPRQPIWDDLLGDWETVLEQWHVVPRLQQHVASPSEDPLFTGDAVVQLRDITGRWLRKQAAAEAIDWSVPANQPYALRAMHALSCAIQDKDKHLFKCLLAGVPTGCTSAIPPSNCFIPTPVDDSTDDSWVLCEDNWKGARDDPDALESLVEEELRQGWVEELPSMEVAHERWQGRIAMMKLNIVKSDGRKDRLIADATASGTNASCRVPETVSYTHLRAHET